jgi:hypothetical protein
MNYLSEPFNPVFIPTYVTAKETAVELSKTYPNWYFHLSRKSEGGYMIDVLKDDYSNEKHLATFKNGEITL